MTPPSLESNQPLPRQQRSDEPLLKGWDYFDTKQQVREFVQREKEAELAAKDAAKRSKKNKGKGKQQEDVPSSMDQSDDMTAAPVAFAEPA